jgi:hypothetical protein
MCFEFPEIDVIFVGGRDLLKLLENSNENIFFPLICEIET